MGLCLGVKKPLWCSGQKTFIFVAPFEDGNPFKLYAARSMNVTFPEIQTANAVGFRGEFTSRQRVAPESKSGKFWERSALTVRETQQVVRDRLIVIRLGLQVSWLIATNQKINADVCVNEPRSGGRR
jgi:hypothetical protein